MLGKGCEAAAHEALIAFPNGMQIGGEIELLLIASELVIEAEGASSVTKVTY